MIGYVPHLPLSLSLSPKPQSGESPKATHTQLTKHEEHVRLLFSLSIFYPYETKIKITLFFLAGLAFVWRWRVPTGSNGIFAEFLLLLQITSVT